MIKSASTYEADMLSTAGRKIAVLLRETHQAPSQDGKVRRREKPTPRSNAMNRNQAARNHKLAAEKEDLEPEIWLPSSDAGA